MAFCPNCGAETGSGRFCGKCGATLNGGPTPGPTQTTGSGYGAAPAPAATAGGMSENLAGALCYLFGFITGVLFLVLEPYNRNKTVRFHAFQSIFLNIAIIAISFALSFVAAILIHIPFIGWAFLSLLWGVLWLGAFVLWLFLMWKAYNNEKFVLPVVGPLAEKQA